MEIGPELKNTKTILETQFSSVFVQMQVNTCNNKSKASNSRFIASFMREGGVFACIYKILEKMRRRRTAKEDHMKST